MPNTRIVVAVLLCLALLLGCAGCAKDTTEPSPPGNVSLSTAGNNRTPRFDWEKANDEGSGVARYWVKMDLGDWIDNGDVTSYLHKTQLSDGSHSFSVVAEDKSGNLGDAADLHFVIDTTPPVISEVRSTAAPGSVVVTWSTSEPADSQVEYGTSAFYGGSSSLDGGLAVGHSVTLTGLTAGDYHYRVKSVDSHGNRAVCKDYTVTACGSAAPTISGLDASDTTDRSVRISWNTAEPATTQVAYGETIEYGAISPIGEALVTRHEVTIVGLTSDTTYHFKALSVDACGQQSTSEDWIFETLWVGPDGETEYEGVVYDGYTIVGADGQDIALVNNPDAENVTWAELKQFLESDQTNRRIYRDTSYVCADFAETLHNNAELAGIRAAYVSVRFKPICESFDSSSPYQGCWYCLAWPNNGHACNAFMTTDRGLVFVDDTGTEFGDGDDSTVSVGEGQLYVPVSIFSDTEWCPTGRVTAFKITW